MAGQIRVGSAECSVRDVAENLRMSKSYHLLTEKWSDLARKLNLLEVDIKAWKHKLRNHPHGLNDIIFDILDYWVGQEASRATLDKLMDALISHEMTELADELNFKFLNQPRSNQGQEINSAFVIFPNSIGSIPESSNASPSEVMQARIGNQPAPSPEEENSAATILANSVAAIPESSRASQSDEIVQVGSKITYFPKKYLGGGYMGSEVYVGKFEGKIDVAVKRLSTHYYSIVEKEVQLLSRTDKHQNVIRYYCNEVTEGFRYIVLELCCANLKDWVEGTEEKKKGITDLEILTQCVSGLIFIHEKGVVHRDIKPSNILLLKLNTEKMIVKISDFGVSKLIDESRMSFTASGSAGSQGWIARELWTAKKGDKITHYPTIDIFSLGCIFYYVVTKGHPFGDDDSPSRRQINIEDGKVKISQGTRYDSRGMTDLIKMMIDSSPIKRPPLSVVKSHPVFWSSQKVMQFSYKVNAFRDIKTVFVLEAFKELELVGKDNELVFKKNEKWTDKASHKIGVNFESIKYKNTVTDLNRAFRNYYDHRKEGNKPDIIKNASEEEYVSLWLELFPHLLTCLWVAFRKLYNNGVQDFAEFYEDATNPFWSGTERFRLINNGLEVNETSTGLTASLGSKSSGDSTLAGPSTSSKLEQV